MLPSNIFIVAQSQPQAATWPDAIDWPVTVAFLALAFGVPLLGYVCIGLDIRAYLRSLRRALVLVSNYRPELPQWVRKDTPRCVLALGLTLPCTTEDILAAYREKVKLLHPDRGGDRRAFLRLQAHFEQAMALLEGNQLLSYYACGFHAEMAARGEPLRTVPVGAPAQRFSLPRAF